MNQHESNKLNMFVSTDSVMTEHQDEVDTVKALKDAKVELEADIQDIKTKDKEFDEKSNPKGKTKKDARDALIVTVIHIAGGIYSYAYVNHNIDLKQQVDLTDSDIHNLSDMDLETKSENIFSLATANSAMLADYGVTADDLTKMRAEIDAFVLAKKHINSGTADRSGVRTSLTDYFSKTDMLLENRIDKLMNGFRKKDLEFYNSYWAARNIWDKGGSHTKAGPIVINNEKKTVQETAESVQTTNGQAAAPSHTA